MNKSAAPLIILAVGFALFFLGYLFSGTLHWIIQVAGVVGALAGFALYMQSKNQ